MIPVFQTQFVKTHGKGNCVQAAVASILDLSLDYVPNFREATDMMKALDDFLLTRALRRISVFFSAGYQWGDASFEDVHPSSTGNRIGGVPILIFGKSPRNADGHAIVGEFIGRYNWKMLHDPHPDGTGIEGTPKSIHWFVQIRPHRLCHHAEPKFHRLFGPLRAKAREMGYALAVHGSLVRDIDLIACPWTVEAVGAQQLAEAMFDVAKQINGVAFYVDREHAANPGYFDRGMPGYKPHARRVWSIHLGDGPYIDLSVMPRAAREDVMKAT